MIPKIIHIIWIGPNTAPKFIYKWTELNPDYDVKIWHDHAVGKYAMTNQHLYDLYDEENSNVWNGRANLLRLEFLHEYGGIYIDADIEPLRPLGEDLLDTELFMAYANEIARGGLLNNAVIGAKPEHPFLELAIKELYRKGSIEQPSHIFSGPTFLTNLAKESGWYDKIDKLPSYYFQPKFYKDGYDYKGDFKPYGKHHWGTTKRIYGKI